MNDKQTPSWRLMYIKKRKKKRNKIHDPVERESQRFIEETGKNVSIFFCSVEMKMRGFEKRGLIVERVRLTVPVNRRLATEVRRAAWERDWRSSNGPALSRSLGNFRPPARTFPPLARAPPR